MAKSVLKQRFSRSMSTLTEGVKGKKFGSGKNDYNCKSERSASSIRGVVSVLDAFPISFLKTYYPSFEFVQQIMSQNKHIHLKKHERCHEISQEMC